MIEGAADESNTLAKLAASRAEIRRLLEPPPQPDPEIEDGGTDGVFPRSRTMRLLMSTRGIGTVGAMVGGLLLARPALLLRLLRMIPAGAVGRMLLIKAVAALRNRGG
jgi:hypothetical protein